MRYYRIEFAKPDGTAYTFKSLNGQVLTSLLPQGPQTPQYGLTNPAALLVEFDLPMANYANPDNNAWLRVWGLGLEDIGSTANLNGLTVSIYGGMARGLPLANPAQAGLLVRGQVWQAYGNWVGTDQTIDMILKPGGDFAGTYEKPGNFPFSWKAGTPLADAIKQTLAVGMPKYPAKVQISPKLVIGYDQVGYYQTLGDFADFIYQLSLSIITDDNYDGVIISTNGDTILVIDGTVTPPPKQIAFQDLIGQPTWFAPNQISVKFVLRADLQIGDVIQLPPALFTTQLGAVPPGIPNRLTFSGNFKVMHLHHFGNSRQPDAASWNTTAQCVLIQQQVQTGPGGLLGHV
ncbi:MAG TPA: hypothetical protein VHB27_12025 [Rhodopila sp.]|uniref:hypothetical protein n=1 Tax=Rhodopila sp. TaxID=2480087 RepID=UPI002C6068C6|nr:hypothetical protein [Rhodopila sp.]HVY15948.1 hypothetical protein [Rhodopila sp.]